MRQKGRSSATSNQTSVAVEANDSTSCRQVPDVGVRVSSTSANDHFDSLDDGKTPKRVIVTFSAACRNVSPVSVVTCALQAIAFRDSTIDH